MSKEVTIPESELAELKTAIAERDRYIAWADEAIKKLKDTVEAQMGYDHFQAVKSAKLNILYFQAVRKQNLSPEDTAKIDREIEKYTEQLSNVTTTYQGYIRDHPQVANILLGVYGLKFPDVIPSKEGP
ncbi:MAG: hypothetical protein WC294_02255 [Methanoregula sp.]|jgi:hypothetical protein